MTAPRRVDCALVRTCARNGLGAIVAFMTAFAVLTFLLNIVAIAAFGPGADILGHTGPGRIVVYVIALVLAFFFTRASAPPMALGLGRIPLWKNTIARGWLFGIAGYLAYALIMFLGGAVEFKAPRSPADIAAAIPLCAISGFGIAVAEEIVFRGFLLRAAALQLPRWPAIALTGIAFGFFHELGALLVGFQGGDFAFQLVELRLAFGVELGSAGQKAAGFVDLGGAGFTNVYANDLTPLSISAQSIAGQKVCYGDIVIVNPILMKGAIIEIQGEVIHGSGAILDHDAERMTALQSMGFDVFLVTHDMLNDSKQLDTIVRSVCDRLGIRYKAKTEAMKSAETRLRANVLCNWLEIGISRRQGARTT